MNKIISSFAVLMIVCISGSAEAQDDQRWVRKSIRESCDYWGNCRYRYRYYLPAPRVYSYIERQPSSDERWERDERERCLDRKRVVGTEHATVDGALAAAKRSWMSLVRWDHGEKFMNIDIALHYQQRCERSSTNETAAGRVAESIAGSFYTRCEVVAAPCVARRARPEEGDKR